MHSLEIVQWDSTRRDHPGYPGRVSGSGPVTYSFMYCTLSRNGALHIEYLKFSLVTYKSILLPVVDFILHIIFFCH